MVLALMIIQFAVTVIVGIYFYKQLKSQSTAERPCAGTAGRDMEKLNRMRAISLSQPLCETVRPSSLDDIVGQKDAIKALKAILCGPNPQHVIIYGPPGVGKTCVARLALEEAKRSAGTPFRPDAPFIEMDATCIRFDERAIADPLIGSVHDPIYQGAGSLGISGVPQPKEGAVSRAHGGVLFLDEIGEMHPMQMNKLLKVLEDRRVRFESAYYNPYDVKTPRHIHDIFANGMPADFRLIGATTKNPEDIVPALRSRCMEVFFDALDAKELAEIALNASRRARFEMNSADAELIGQCSAGGRDAVNIVQMAAGIARQDGRESILRRDVEWVIDCGRYAQRQTPLRLRGAQIGRVHALAVLGSSQGAVMELEAVARPGSGKITVTGIIDTEEIGREGHKLTRLSTARSACQNVISALAPLVKTDKYDIHLNFPGGAPIDGPSAGTAMAVAAYSAMLSLPVRGDMAFTGEVSVQGRVLPVGGVTQKILSAMKAGLRKVVIPKDNYISSYDALAISVIPVTALSEVINLSLCENGGEQSDAPNGAEEIQSLPAACALTER